MSSLYLYRCYFLNFLFLDITKIKITEIDLVSLLKLSNVFKKRRELLKGLGVMFNLAERAGSVFSSWRVLCSHTWTRSRGWDAETWEVWAACVNTVQGVHKQKDVRLKTNETSPSFKICFSLFAVICSSILISKAFLLM